MKGKKINSQIVPPHIYQSLLAINHALVQFIYWKSGGKGGGGRVLSESSTVTYGVVWILARTEYWLLILPNCSAGSPALHTKYTVGHLQSTKYFHSFIPDVQ